MSNKAKTRVFLTGCPRKLTEEELNELLEEDRELAERRRKLERRCHYATIEAWDAIGEIPES